MYRADHSSASTILPPPTPPVTEPGGRYFSPGDKNTGALGTVLQSEWLNMMQEEGANLVISAGLTLDKADRTQWTQAIDAKIAAGVGGLPLPFVRIAGDTMTGDLTINGAGGLSVAANAVIGQFLHLGWNAVADWRFGRNATFGTRAHEWRTDGWSDDWNETTGIRQWTSPGPRVLMSLDPTGLLLVDGSIATQGNVTAYTGAFQVGAAIIRQEANGDLGFFTGNGMTFRLDSINNRIWGGGNMRIDGNVGEKMVAGPWDAISDARIKQNIEPYTAGLAAIKALHPKTFSFIPETGLDPAKRYISLIAQDVAPVIPEAVTVTTPPEQSSNLAGLGIDDLLRLDITPVIYALVNGMQEITARLEALEGEAEATSRPAPRLADREP